MTAPLSIMIWLALFTAWIWIMDRVNREFWYTGNCALLLSWTFYTLGVVGVFLLLGRQNRSPTIARWVRDLLESAPVESIGRRMTGVRELQHALEPEEDKEEKAGVGGPGGDTGRTAHDPGISCDILDFVLKKAVGKQASEVRFEQFPDELRITYVTGASTETQKVLARGLRLRVINALKARIARSSRPAGSDASGPPVLEATINGRQVMFNASMESEGTGGRIVLTRPAAGCTRDQAQT